MFSTSIPCTCQKYAYFTKNDVTPDWNVAEGVPFCVRHGPQNFKPSICNYYPRITHMVPLSHITDPSFEGHVRTAMSTIDNNSCIIFETDSLTDSSHGSQRLDWVRGVICHVGDYCISMPWCKILTLLVSWGREYCLGWRPALPTNPKHGLEWDFVSM